MTAPTPIEVVRQALEANACEPKEMHGRITAKCPAHADRSPSLSVTEGDSGKVLVHCFAGCDLTAVTEALELKRSDLFPPDAERNGVRSRLAATYTYEDQRGAPTIRVLRYEPKDFRQQHWDGTRWAWGAGGMERVPFRLPLVRRAITQGHDIWVVEGEKDVLAVEATDPDIVATCFLGGAGKATDTELAYMWGANAVHIVADSDTPGRAHAKAVAAGLTGHVAEIFVYEGDAGKDVCDHLASGRSLDDLSALWGDDEGIDALWPGVEVGDAIDDDEVHIHGWEPVDIATILAGNYEAPVPTVGTLLDDTALFYAGRINGVHGESGAGKSWVAFTVAAQEIHAAHHVIVVDLEDHVISVLARLSALGCSPQELVTHLTYIAPEMAMGIDATDDMAALITERDTTLVVIDSIGEAMALHGIDPNADGEVAQWFRKVPRSFARLGPAVAVIDHVPKAKGTNGTHLYAIGSQRKRAAIDGAAYSVEQVAPLSKGTTGRLRLTVAKDRGGARPTGSVACEATVWSSETGDEVRITMSPVGQHDRPTNIMEKVSRLLERDGAMTARQIRSSDSVQGRAVTIDVAIRELIEGSYVVIEKGPNGALFHRHERAFNAADWDEDDEP